MKRFRAIAGLTALTSVASCVLVAVFPGTAVAAASTSLVADAYLKSSAPTTNYGSSPLVTVDGSPSTYGYFRFTVSVPVGEVVTRAVFRCWAGSSNVNGGVVRRVSNAWDEHAITWANAPMPDLKAVPVGSTGPVSSGTWARADVTSAVAGSGTVSFAMTTASATAWSCVSREKSRQRQAALDISTTTTPTQTTSTPVPTPVSPPVPSPTSVTSSAAPSPSPSVLTSSSAAPPVSHTSLALPARGTFYYPWFPEAWNQSSYNPATHYHPSAGYYATTSMFASHVQSMLYGGFAFAASSWWGQGSKEDARFGPLLAATHGTPLKIAPYYEAEGNAVPGVSGSPDPTSAQIASDLNYIAAHYINDPNYLWVGGKPAIFVYGDGGDSCATATRWARAASQTRFYVVLKVFAGYQTCADQPDNWHQYGPASESDSQGVHSYTISPGFYKFSESAPRLVRDPTRWLHDVMAMNCSTADFKLVTTFNEWGEGSSVESANEWASASEQGTYLDTLHAYRTC